MDEVSGDGSAELNDHGSIEIEFAYHNGDESRPQPLAGRNSTGIALPTVSMKSPRG